MKVEELKYRLTLAEKEDEEIEMNVKELKEKLSQYDEKDEVICVFKDNGDTIIRGIDDIQEVVVREWDTEEDPHGIVKLISK